MNTKKQLKFILSIVSIFILMYANGQALDTSITNNYSNSVVAKVYDVVTKTKTTMTVARQKLFADFFERCDSTITDMISSASDPANIETVKTMNQSSFDSLLTPTEKFAYYTSAKYGSKTAPIPFSQLSLAVKFKDSIGIDGGVVSSLLLKLDTLKQMKDSFYSKNPGSKKSLDTRAFESLTLNNLLSEDQYNKLLIIKNTAKSKNYALTDWQELQTRGLASGYDSVTTISQLAGFYLARQNAYDRYAYDAIQQSANIKSVYDNKPAALNVLMHARRNPNNDTNGQSFQW